MIGGGVCFFFKLWQNNLHVITIYIMCIKQSHFYELFLNCKIGKMIYFTQVQQGRLLVGHWLRVIDSLIQGSQSHVYANLLQINYFCKLSEAEIAVHVHIQVSVPRSYLLLFCSKVSNSFLREKFRFIWKMFFIDKLHLSCVNSNILHLYI